MTDEIDRWIEYMRKNPSTWKKHHTEFINAQFEKADLFIRRLAKQPGGKKKIIEAYNIKNVKGYPGLLGD